MAAAVVDHVLSSKRNHYFLRSTEGGEELTKRPRVSEDAVPSPVRVKRNKILPSGCSSSTPSAQDQEKQTGPQTRVERYGHLFDSEESEESEDDMLTQEELEKTEGWRLLMEGIDRKYGRKSTT